MCPTTDLHPSPELLREFASVVAPTSLPAPEAPSPQLTPVPTPRGAPSSAAYEDVCMSSASDDSGERQATAVREWCRPFGGEDGVALISVVNALASELVRRIAPLDKPGVHAVGSADDMDPQLVAECVALLARWTRVHGFHPACAFDMPLASFDSHAMRVPHHVPCDLLVVETLFDRCLLVSRRTFVWLLCVARAVAGAHAWCCNRSQNADMHPFNPEVRPLRAHACAGCVVCLPVAGPLVSYA